MVFVTHSELHALAKRALPINMCLYRHAIIIYRLFNEIMCENEFVHLKFQLFNKVRSTKLVFIKIQNFDTGKNILLNRLHKLNNKIEKQWLELSLGTFKIKCKNLFLLTNWTGSLCNFHLTVVRLGGPVSFC